MLRESSFYALSISRAQENGAVCWHTTVSSTQHEYFKLFHCISHHLYHFVHKRHKRGQDLTVSCIRYHRQKEQRQSLPTKVFSANINYNGQEITSMIFRNRELRFKWLVSGSTQQSWETNPNMLNSSPMLPLPLDSRHTAFLLISPFKNWQHSKYSLTVPSLEGSPKPAHLFLEDLRQTREDLGNSFIRECSGHRALLITVWKRILSACCLAIEDYLLKIDLIIKIALLSVMCIFQQEINLQDYCSYKKLTAAYTLSQSRFCQDRTLTQDSLLWF